MKEKEKIEILEKIDLYIRGKLSQEEIDELWKVFLKHPEYYEMLETEVHLRSLIRKGKKPPFISESGKSSNTEVSGGFKGWFYAAVAAVLLALGLQYFSMQHPDPISSFAVDEIEQSHLTGADVYRSDEQHLENNDIAINSALATAYEGETETAIKEFQEILSQSLNSRQRARVEMNLGILFYNTGQYETAKDHFQSVTEMEELTEYQEEKSWWFLGNSYLNLNQPLEAREAVSNVYSMNGRFQSAAHKLLEKLDLRIGNISSEAPARLGE